MSPLRLEYAGTLYHVTSRGDRRETIYRDDNDRKAWLEGLATICLPALRQLDSACLLSDGQSLSSASGNREGASRARDVAIERPLHPAL